MKWQNGNDTDSIDATSAEFVGCIIPQNTAVTRKSELHGKNVRGTQRQSKFKSAGDFESVLEFLATQIARQNWKCEKKRKLASYSCCWWKCNENITILWLRSHFFPLEGGIYERIAHHFHGFPLFACRTRWWFVTRKTWRSEFSV